MSDETEAEYLDGQRSVWREMLRRCIRELAIDDMEAARARWLIEREDVVSGLRQLSQTCEYTGWDESNHLGDVIDHLNDVVGDLLT